MSKSLRKHQMQKYSDRNQSEEEKVIQFRLINR